jgi:chorismate-pyruvate lyase
VITDSITAPVAGPRVSWAPPIPPRSLDIGPFDRMLLTADGTVTTLLEACTGEAIVTRTTRQAGPATLDRMLAVTGRWWHPDTQLLELAPSERLIARRVTLRGARSGVAYVLAESLVVPDRLPGVIADRLLRAGASLGRLLAARQLETRRAVLDVVSVRAGEASDYLGVRPSATLARRTYTIVVGQRTVAVVTEWLFPGRLVAAARARGGATAAPWQPFSRSGENSRRGSLGSSFVADL